MKKKNKMIIMAFICFLFVITLCACQKNKAKNVDKYTYNGEIYEESYDYKNNYGYKYFLSTNINQAKLYEDAYFRSVDFKNKKINLKTSNYAELFKVECSTYSLTLDETRQVLDVFVYENPMFYFLSEIDYEDNGSNVSLEISKDYYLYNDRVRYYNLIEEELEKFDDGVATVNGEFDTIKYIYDYITLNMNYCEEDEGDLYYAHNILGFFDKKEGVCETYCKTFILLCNRCNIECIPAYSVEHVWNLAKVYDMWYIFDLTNDNFGFTKFHYDLEARDDSTYDPTMIKAPETALSSLSIGEFVLLENGDEIYRSHSIEDVYRHFNGGKYELFLDTCNREKLIERYFYINSFNDNYESLVIFGDDDYNACTYLINPLYVSKDLTIKKVNYHASSSKREGEWNIRYIYAKVGVTIVYDIKGSRSFSGVTEEYDYDNDSGETCGYVIPCYFG